MKYPNFNEEKKLWKRGLKCVAGLDEAGRGPLAGPVVAAAVAIGPKIKNEELKIFKGVNDSKKLSEKQREYFYGILTSHPQVKWGIGIVSEKTIDRINVFEATKLAMKKAIKSVVPNFHDRENLAQQTFLILDGNFTLDLDEAAFAKSYGVPKQKSIIRADQKVFSVAAASIIAKVTRDRLMQKYHKKYPQYGFDKHKGYGTKAHFASLEKCGPCKIHRRTFWPISNLSTG